LPNTDNTPFVSLKFPKKAEAKLGVQMTEKVPLQPRLWQCDHSRLETGELVQNTVVAGKNKYTLRYVNEIPLNQTENAPEVNFLECKSVEYQEKNRIEKTFT
jgi:hypothetical protein